MSEHYQLHRLQQAELTPGPELWARLEGRLNGRPAAERRPALWYWAAAACLLLALAALPGLWTAPATSPAVAHIEEASKTVAHANAPLQGTLGGSSENGASAATVTAVRDEEEATAQPAARPALVAKKTKTAPKLLASRPAKVRKARRAEPKTADEPMLAVVREHSEEEPALVLGYEPNTQEVELAHPLKLLQDSVPTILAAVAMEDSLQRLVAFVAGPGPGQQKRDTSRHKKQPQRQTLINKLNRAMRWLPGGSAWPNIRFEKAEVAIADYRRPPDEPVY